MDFSKRLNEILKNKNISQHKLSKMTGIGQSTLSELISGKIKDTTTERALAIAKALDIRIEQLLCNYPEDYNQDISEHERLGMDIEKFILEYKDYIPLIKKIKNGNVPISEVEKHVDYLIWESEKKK